jgi:phospholipid/cholesterol/gamma-HCH transport system substrate-binding protein
MPMKPIADRDPFKLGLAALAAGGLVIALVVVFSVVSFGTKSYSAVLAQTAGLRVGEDVQIAGVPVGQVTGIELAGDTVKVSFNASKDIRLGSETRAAVKVATLLGTHYLQLSPKGSGELPNDTIPLGQTSVPYNLQDVLEKGTSRLEALDADKLAQALTAMSDTLAGSGDDLGQALTGVSRLSSMIADRSSQTTELLQAARSVTDQLSEGSTDLLALMQQTNLVVSEVTARRAAIHRLLVESTRLSDNLVSIVNATKGDIQPALRDFKAALATLKSQDKQLKGVLEVMAPAVRYITNASGTGPWVDLYLPDTGLTPNDVQCKVGC